MDMTLTLGLLMAATVLLAGFTVVNHRRLRSMQSALSAQSLRFNALNQQLLATLDALPDLMFEMDLNGRFLSFHSPRTDLLAVAPRDFIGKTLSEVMPAEVAAISMSALQEAHQTGYSQGRQIELTLPDGPHWFELSVARKPPFASDTPAFIVLSRDISDRKRAEQKVERLSRLYSALSQCNQAIVRCHNEAELFPILCRDAVNFGGLKMAWIGVVDPADQLIKPVAAFGSGTDYLECIALSVDPASPLGQGPSGIAMRQDQPFWCQDFQHDPSIQPWHEQGVKYGWGASAAIPLHRKGQTMGLFSVYAGEKNAFDDAVQQLLLEMAMDISYALDRFVDEAQRISTLDALRESEERYRKAFQNSLDSININRLSDGLFMDVNHGFERITGWSHAEVVGKTSMELNIWHNPHDRQALVDALLREQRCLNLEADFVCKDGSVCHGLMSAELLRFRDVDCILTITRDMTDKKRAEAQIERLALFDQLTGLPNRTQLQDRFKFALNLAQRGGGTMALMFLDLDHFKNINDTLGHSIGDQLLMEVSSRIKAILRQEDTLSRLGGDEFILLLPDTNQEGARHVALKLIAEAAKSCQIEQYELINTVSIGIAMYPQDGEDFETLSKNADTAMYRVKRAARNDFCFFTQEMQANSARSLQLVNALRHALARNELRLEYQPMVAIPNGRVLGAEALLRWHQPELGYIAPTEFIPLAEDSGQILEIGEWVLRNAVTQLKLWLQSGLPPMVMAVNLSAVQFRQPDLPEMITSILHQARVPRDCLEIELTEATAMDNPQRAIDIMNRLHERGIRISIDDFGTGYSSLSYLKKFKVSKLKIDRSFVSDISVDADDKAIVTSIINLARSMGLKTIAEGVETSSQLDYLRLQGCDEAQGFLFSQPLSAGTFEQYVNQQP